MNEKEIDALEYSPEQKKIMHMIDDSETTCCGRKMAFLGQTYSMISQFENNVRWVCFECGGCIDFTLSQMDEEEVDNMKEESETEYRRWKRQKVKK